MPTVAEEYDLVGGSKTVAEEYGLVGGNKTIAEEYGLSKDIAPAKKKRLPILETAQDVAIQVPTSLAQGLVDIPVSIGSVVSKLLGNPPEEIQQAVESFRVRPKPQTKLGEAFGNVAEFLGPTGAAGGLLRAGAKQILKRQLPKVAETAGAFAGGEAAIETPRTVTGEIDVEQFIKDVGLTGITGGALGLAGKITNPKIKLLGEWVALTQTAPLVGEQRFSTPEEALYGTVLLGAFKGVQIGINRLAAQQGKSPEQVKDEIKNEAEVTGKSPQEILNEKEKGAKIVPSQAPLKEEEIIETPPQAREGIKPTTQQPTIEGASKAGEAQPVKPPEAKPEEPVKAPIIATAKTRRNEFVKRGGKWYAVLYQKDLGWIEREVINLPKKQYLEKIKAPLEQAPIPPAIGEKSPQPEPGTPGSGAKILQAGAGEALAKEPWQMTKEEFREKAEKEWFKGKRWINKESQLTNLRKEVVREALFEGKPIPPEVLKDYPDLQPKAGEAQPVQAIIKSHPTRPGVYAINVGKNRWVSGGAGPAGGGDIADFKTIQEAQVEATRLGYRDINIETRLEEPAKATEIRPTPISETSPHRGFQKQAINILTEALDKAPDAWRGDYIKIDGLSIKNEKAIIANAIEVIKKGTATTTPPPFPTRRLKTPSMEELFKRGEITKSDYVATRDADTTDYLGLVPIKEIKATIPPTGGNVQYMHKGKQVYILMREEVEANPQIPQGRQILEDFKKVEPEEPTLSGGRPGEFTPEEADLFRQAELALQSGDRESFEEIMRLFGEKRRVVEGRMKGVTPEGAETLRQLGKEEARQPISDAEIERMAELQGQEFEVIAQRVRDKIPGYDSATIRLFLNDLRTKTNEAVETKDISKLRPTFLLASKVTSEAGRGLRQVQLDALGTSKIKDIDAGLDYIEKIRTKDPAFHDQLFKMLETLKTPEEKFRFIASMKEPTFSSYLWEYYYNSILSSPGTQIVNTVGNILHLLLQTPLRGLQATAEIPIAAIQSRPREAFFSDILPLWSGIKVGFPRGWAKAKQVWKTGMADDMTKLGREAGVNMEAFSKSLNPTLRKIAPVLSFPTRTMRAMDIIFRSIAYESKIIELAEKTAWQEIKTGKITEAQFAQRTGALAEKPTPNIISSAGKFADYAVFTDKPDQFTQMIMKARDIIPGARFVIPFIATPSRLFVRGLEITPGTALIRALGSPTFRKRLKTPEVSEIAAKQLAGLLLGYIAWNFADGSLTGPGPKDKADREAFYRQGKLPWAVKIGDKWVSYRRFEPLNTPIASVALLWESFKKGELKEKDLAQKASAMVIGLGRNLLDSSYLAGVSDILTILANGEQASDRLEKTVQRQFFSLIPFSSLWRSSTKAIEAATEGETLVRKPETFKETLESQLPFLSKNVPTKRDVFGREVILEGGPIRQFLPFKATTETQDLVEKELERLNITPGIPPKKIAGKELTHKEHDKYVRLSGQRMRINLFQWISNPIWQLAPDGQKRKIVERAIDESRKYARQQLDIQKVFGSAK